SALDNDELSVVNGSGAQIVPIGTPPTDWGRMLKGASYLVLYNLVEAFIRKGFQAVFDTIRGDSLCATELIRELRVQWVEQKNRRIKHFDGSPGIYMKIAVEAIEELVDKSVATLKRDRLPLGGNLDADKVREVCRLHGVNDQVDPAAKG